ncbi:MAG: hypothetical protein WC327_02965 [Candidatus Cloacimonadia bacterium]
MIDYRLVYLKIDNDISTAFEQQPKKKITLSYTKIKPSYERSTFKYILQRGENSVNLLD